MRALKQALLTGASLEPQGVDREPVASGSYSATGDTYSLDLGALLGVDLVRSTVTVELTPNGAVWAPHGLSANHSIVGDDNGRQPAYNR